MVVSICALKTVKDENRVQVYHNTREMDAKDKPQLDMSIQTETERECVHEKKATEPQTKHCTLK